MSLKLKDIIAGNTRRVDLTFTNDSGAAYDISGATIAFAAEDANGTVSLNLNSTDNPTQFVILSAAGGQVRLTLSSSNTNLAAGSYNFGAQATLTDGTVVEDTGKFKVNTQYVT